MRLKQYIIEAAIPDLKAGEYAIPFRKKEKVRDFNKKTNRMKNFKRNRYFKTDINPEDRSLKNVPRYANKDVKCTFMQWLGLKGNGSDGPQGTDGKFYGWSHRAVHGFGVGDKIKPGTIGNKHEYTPEVQKEYNRLYDLDWKNKTKEADAYLKTKADFEPYTIKTEKEAKEHAIRFGKDVS